MHYGFARAIYRLPAFTSTVFFLTKSRTWTLPRATFVSVDVQRSSTIHFVPTTVAALRLPLVWKRPLPSPQRRRFLTFFLAAVALPLALQPVSFSTSASTVIGFVPLVCVTLNRPS